MPVTRHIPERTCIACGQVKPKKEMVRLVRTTDKIEVDPTGKKSGRGAYLCRTADCWKSGLNGNKVERALKTSLANTGRDKLMEDLKELCGGESK